MTLHGRIDSDLPAAVDALSDTLLRRWAASGATGMVHVRQSGGLAVYVGTRAIVFHHFFRSAGGKKTSTRLGQWPAMSASAAQQAVDVRMQAKRTGDNLAQMTEKRVWLPLADALDDWAQGDPVRTRLAAAVLNHLADWLDTPVRQIDGARLQRDLERLFADSPGAAQNAQAALRAALSLAVKQGNLTHHPLAAEQWLRTDPRSISLPARALNRLWTGLGDHLPHRLAALAKVQLITATRWSEVRAVTPLHLDLALGTWRLRGDETKGGKDHTYPLVEPAIDVLRPMVEATRDENAPVFAGPRGGLPSSRDRKRIIAAMNGILGLPDERRAILHDYRRAVGETLREMGYSLDVIHFTLNHATAARGSVLDRTYASRHRDPQIHEAVCSYAAIVVDPANIDETRLKMSIKMARRQEATNTEKRSAISRLLAEPETS